MAVFRSSVSLGFMLQWVGHHHKKIREIGTGLVLYESINFVYDFMFYPFAIAYWGFALGGTIAVFFTFVINTTVFVLYEYMAIDWLGAHALRQLEEKENKSALERLVTWIGKKKVTWWEKVANPIVFIALTLPIDPVIVAIHYRRQHFGGISARDWCIFLLATSAASAWWLLKVDLIIIAVRYIWTMLSTNALLTLIVGA
jgi:hypothetical protein